MQAELWSLLCSFVADTMPESLEARLSFFIFWWAVVCYSATLFLLLFVFRMIYVVI